MHILCLIAPTTQLIMGGFPSDVDPALINARIKRDLVHKAKARKNPCGTGIAGVVERHTRDMKKAVEDQYIHGVDTTLGDEVFIVYTFIPGLARLMLSARAVLHDFTYKRLNGSGQEWEVVIWYDRLNIRTSFSSLASSSGTSAETAFP